MPTWKLNPDDQPLRAVLDEFIRRQNIDVGTRRGAARVRAVTALIEAVATENPAALVPHYDALEDGDHKVLFDLVEDYQASLRRMQNETRRSGRYRSGKV